MAEVVYQEYGMAAVLAFTHLEVFHFKGLGRAFFGHAINFRALIYLDF